MPYLMHPEHGFHHASGDEVESMLKNGWVPDTIRFEPKEKENGLQETNEEGQGQLQEAGKEVLTKRAYNRKPK